MSSNVECCSMERTVQPKQFIYQTEQIFALESLAQTQFGIDAMVMMQRAGEAALQVLIQNWPHAHTILIFCGGGNNGGDGYALATMAHARGLHVKIVQVGETDKLKPMAKEHYQACRMRHIDIQPFSANLNLSHVDVVIDAVCGIGLHEKLRANTLAAVTFMNQIAAPIFSLDMPTGIDADTGQVLGDAVRATTTLTFIGLKLGLLTGSGCAYAGEILCHDLDLPPALFTLVTPVAQKKELIDFRSYLKPRTKDWHKGLSGHVLIVGGAPGYAGAARMAGMAALRVGAGLVSVATKTENAFAMNINCPELMCHAVETAEDLTPLLKKCDVVVIGPGLGQTNWSKDMWHAILAVDLPLILDADALNLLASNHQKNDNWILTPHPGEAARLLDKQVNVIQANRLQAAKLIQEAYGGTCVLKGSGTLITSQNALTTVCTHGNPGMASAGMGDILSGVIGGLRAQKIPNAIAAELGVLIHAMAGDLAAEAGMRGTIATDLLPYIRRLSNFV